MYQPVDDSEKFADEYEENGSSRQNSLPGLEDHGSGRMSRYRSPNTSIGRYGIILTFANLIFFAASILILYISSRNVDDIESNRDNRLIKLTSTYSPVFDKIDIVLKEVRQNGSFWPQNPPSVFELPPSPSVDAAWDRLADTHAVAFTASEMSLTEKDPSELWPWPANYRIPGHPFPTPYKTYMALPNVFHQIHCLNMMRKMIHPSYYGDLRAKTNHSHFPIGAHLGHCQYMLLQKLMCHADLEMITFGKVRGTPGPFPDFGVESTCRDWDAILEWKERNQVVMSDEEWKEILITPEGIRELDPEGRTVPPV